MCGIAGYWDFQKSLSKESLERRILGMTQTMKDRGPDSGGLWLDAANGLALGQRRLAIRDLSPLGHQPMVSPDSRYVLTYNGEIYNTDEIKESLKTKGIQPKGSSDTEVLLLSIMAFGVRETLKKALGMFAFGLWDRRERKLTLARDRFGVKPLYYTLDNHKRFLFASKPDAFWQAGDWNPEINMDAASLFLRFSYIPAPHSIWKGVYKLPAAHFLEFDKNGIQKECYWDILETTKEAMANPLGLNEDDLVRELDNLLTDSVRRRLVSDVPLGAFLSGGIDSSTIVALMQKCSNKPVKTFSIGFDEEAYNEAPYAKVVASHLKTDHTELYLSGKEAWEIIPELPYIYDEPFGDNSSIPTTLLSRLTKQHVTIALSGDGGDEFFAGYSRYANCLNRAPEFGQPSLSNRLLGKSIKALSVNQWDSLSNLLPEKYRPRNAGVRLYNYADLVLDGSFSNFYQKYFLQYWWYPETILTGGGISQTLIDSPNIPQVIGDRLAYMQFIDSNLYLEDNILVKVDRASMSCSLEVRVPMLDHRVFSFAQQIPPALRQKNGQGKYLLKKVLEKYVPNKLIDRPKMGFGIPVGKWITGPLREWSESLLSPESLKNSGIFKVKPVRNAWDRYNKGSENYQNLIWLVLIFMDWLKRKPCIQPEIEPLPVTYA